jgi:hypothetical protein
MEAAGEPFTKLIHRIAWRGHSANFAQRLYEKWFSGGDSLL